MNPQVLSTTSSVLIAFIASILIFIMFFGLLILWLIDGRIKKETALHALFSSLTAWVFTYMIKTLLPIPRPFRVNGFPPLTLTVPTDSSFPSLHSAVAFALATSIWLHNKNLGFLYIILACMVGWGRIESNVHYLPDILFGAFVGIGISLIIEKLHLFKLVSKR